jgi:type IV pilus assembly protein PilY1
MICTLRRWSRSVGLVCLVAWAAARADDIEVDQVPPYLLDGLSSAAGVGVSTGSVVISSPSLDADSLVYQAVTDVTRWRGQLRAYRVSQGYGREPCATKARGELCERADAPYWVASATVRDPADRIILTQVDGTPGAFEPSMFDVLSDAQKRGLLGCPRAPAAWIGDFAHCSLDLSWEQDPLHDARRTLALQRIEWLRGDSSRETGEDGGLRQRDGHLLGDILRSNIVFVGAPGGRFNDPDYIRFRGPDGWRDRPPVVYVGANDGMLHAFDANDGEELFAFVPESVYPHLADLSVPDYGRADGGVPKQAFVDGRLNAADAKFTDQQGRGGWRTVLVGSLGLGAQGVYALNVTDPLSVTARSAGELVLWEFTDASGSDADDGALDGRDLGYSLAEPAIVRIDDDLHDGREPVWVALVSNGYNNTATTGEIEAHCSDGDPDTNCTVSQTGNAVLYVLNLGGDDRARIRAKLDTGLGADDDPRSGAARTNALAQVTAVDADGDLIADLAYAGDLFGNLWRFDLVDLWRPPRRLFSATDHAGDPQPITTKVVYQRHPYGIGALILFGTGQYLSAADRSDKQVQSFYAIWDDGGAVFDGAASDTTGDAVATRDNLLAQWFESEVSVQDRDANAVVSLGRSSTDHAIDWSLHRGWYIDLIRRGGDAEGERVIVAPQVRANRVVFVSMTPGECCGAGGSSWVNVLRAKDGSRLGFSPFDYDLDGRFGAADRLSTEDGDVIVGSSIRLVTDGGGVYSAPSILGLGGGQFQGIISDSQGGLIRLQEAAALDWRTWRQID